MKTSCSESEILSPLASIFGSETSLTIQAPWVGGLGTVGEYIAFPCFLYFGSRYVAGEVKFFQDQGGAKWSRVFSNPSAQCINSAGVSVSSSSYKY